MYSNLVPMCYTICRCEIYGGKDSMRKFLWLMLVVMAITLTTVITPTTTSAQDNTATVGVRFVHAFPGAGAVDIYVNTSLIAPNVPFAAATPHLNVPVGTHTVAVRAAGTPISEAPLLSQTIIAEAPRTNVELSLIVQPDAGGNPSFVISEDDLNPAQFGQARLHFVHTIPSVGAVNIFTTTGGTIASGVEFGVENRTIDPPVNLYDLVVSTGSTPDESVLNVGLVEVNTGLLYKFIITGTADAPEVIQLATPLRSNDSSATVLTRIAHGSTDAPAVDIYANDVRIIVNLEPGDLTPHIAIPTGDVSLAVRAAGAAPNSEAATTASISLSSTTGAASLVAVGSLSDNTFTFSVFEDNIAALDATTARVRVLNTVLAGAADVTLDGISVADDLRVFSASEEVDIAADNYGVIATIDAGSPLELSLEESTFFGGAYHTVLLFANASAGITVGNTAINTDLGSLPGAVIAEPVVEATVEDTTQDSDTSTSTETTETAAETTTPTEPTSETVDTTTTAVTDTSTSATAPTTDTVAPATTTTNATTTTTAPTTSPRQGLDRTLRAQVNLNPGVNLQCREYPSPDAFSLGLVPNNTVMEIVGYAAGADPEVDTPFIPVGDELVTVFESLPRGEVTTNDDGDRIYIAGQYDDLEIEDIWISALWVTPEGIVIDCWTRADLVLMTYQDDFIDEVDEFFALEGLIELPRPVIRPIPYNYAAAPLDVETAVTSPSTTVDPITQGPVVDRRALPIVAVVNVADDGNLQCREYPSPASRSLGLIQNATQLEVVGFAGPADPEITTPFIPIEDDAIAVFETLPPETEAEFDALENDQIWLSALFTANDGNTIDCWVRLDFLTLIYREDIIDDLPTLFAVDDPEDPFNIFVPVPYNAPATIVDSRAVPSPVGTGTGTTPTDSGSGTDTSVPTTGVTGTINIPQGSNLTMFETPSINGVQIRSLTSGAVVQVVGRTSDNAWLQIRFEALGEGTFIGWISNVGNWVDLPVDVNTLPITG